MRGRGQPFDKHGLPNSQAYQRQVGSRQLDISRAGIVHLVRKGARLLDRVVVLG
jgi:hypothetical protein